MKENQTRNHIAVEAARIMETESVFDFHKAKLKAARRLGVANHNLLPTNAEVEFQLKQYRSLFGEKKDPVLLADMRRAAWEAMKFLKEFNPRLTGAVLDACVNTHSVISIHVFAEVPEQVHCFLINKQIPFTEVDVRLRVGENKYETYPGFRFIAGLFDMEIIVFPAGAPIPRSIIDGKAIARANIHDVEQLLSAG